MRGLVSAEVAAVTVAGLLAGAAVGVLLSQVLVVVLAGVFDPPPSVLTVLWPYLGGAVAVTVVAAGAAVAAALHQARRSPLALLRAL